MDRSATDKSVPILVSAPFELRTLDAIFMPRTVAIIGGGSLAPEGRLLLSNLINQPFGGTVVPIDPNAQIVQGIRAYPGIGAVPERIDLAVILAPAPQVPDIVTECVNAGVKGAIITSAGFRETGAAGSMLEREVAQRAQRGTLRLIGPDSLGVMNGTTGLNATFAPAMARRGHVAFASQSGALGASVLDWSRREQVGLSIFVSVGSMLDVGWGDLIYYLGDDPATRCILLYMESIGDARALLSAAREVALAKPIIVLKGGRTQAGQRAAISHSGALTGSLDVLDAAFRRTGVLRVNTLGELFYMAEALGKQPRPRGPRLTIVTNAGGPAVMAADELMASGGELAELDHETVAALDKLLPANWSRANPIDILDDAGPERYAQALEVASRDPNSNGLLVIFTPQAGADATRTAQAMPRGTARADRPILASWMGGRNVERGEQILNQAEIPTFGYPDTAARVFALMWRYSYNLRGIYETPSLPSDSSGAPNRAEAERIIQAARKAGRTVLTEYESKQLLAAYSLPVVRTCLAQTESEAIALASQIGYPVVLKLHSDRVTHKNDLGGVRLDLMSAIAVKEAFAAIAASAGEVFQGVTVQRMVGPRVGSLRRRYELFLGSSADPHFGPVLLFGAGGEAVEVLADRALALPPLNTTLARRMMEQTRIYRALSGEETARQDLVSLEDLLVRFSQLVVEQPRIQEIDINPLYLGPGESDNREMLALDARVVLYSPELQAEQLPRAAIRAYPMQYVYEWTTRQGAPLTIRPIRPEDEPSMTSFHATLSERSVYLRYLRPILLDQRIAHDRLARVCFNDYDRELALVAERREPATGQLEIVGVGRLSRLHRRNDAEFAILVSDSFQGHGLGTEMLRKLVEIARTEKMDHVIGFISAENNAMLSVCRQLGFRLKHSLEESEVEAVIDLKM